MSSGTFTNIISNSSFRKNVLENSVFPSGFNWTPKGQDVLDAFGSPGGIYYSFANVQQNGTIRNAPTNTHVQEPSAQDNQNMAPHVFFLGYKPAYTDEVTTSKGVSVWPPSLPTTNIV